MSETTRRMNLVLLHSMLAASPVYSTQIPTELQQTIAAYLGAVSVATTMEERYAAFEQIECPNLNIDPLLATIYADPASIGLTKRIERLATITKPL